MFGAGWASGYQAYADNDEGDTGPALQADVLMQPEDGDQRHEYVADGGGGKHVGEIGEGKRGHVAGHEAQQEKDSEDDPRIGEGSEHVGEMMKVDGPHVPHAARQERISNGAEDDDGKQNQVFAKRQNGFPECW